MILLWVAPADCYVLKGPHVLDLMVKKLAGAKTLKVDQKVLVEDPAIAVQPVELKEALSFIFPDRFRSDVRYESTHRVHVHSRGQALMVVDGNITSESEGRFDRYKDLLLYKSRQSLHKILETHGVDLGITSLGRTDDHLVYVIGANFPDDNVSQVWVDKERFLPLRWINIFSADKADLEPERVEFVYRNWKAINGVWYPSQIETFHNHQSVRKIQVTKVQANVDISEELLDIPHLMTIYKKEEGTSTVQDKTSYDSDVDEVQRTIEEFKKKFEP